MRISEALHELEIPALWAEGLRGRGVRVAVLDTGVEHPALAGRLERFAAISARGPIREGPARDSGEHGTHVCGLICAGALAGLQIGVAPEARLIAGAVIEGEGEVVRVLRGLDWLRGQGARVLCLAFGLPDPCPVFASSLANLRAEGTLIVAAAGPDLERLRSPADDPGVIAVGARAATGELEAGRAELLAPGHGLPSLIPGARRPVRRGGSSQACALVAGVAALLVEARPEADPVALRSALIASAGAAGRLRPRAALELLERGELERAPIEDPLRPRFRDPALMRALATRPPAAPDGCVLVASATAPDDRARGRAASVVERVAAALGERPLAVDYLPAGRLAILRASARYLLALAEHRDAEILARTHAGAPLTLS